jgi:long-chain acyl-CoA synthetase
VNVVEFLLEHQSSKERIALITEEGNFTYGALQADLDKVVAYLRSLGIRPGDRSVIISENSYFWVVSYLATLQSGCTAVPLPATIPADECEYIVRSTAPRVAFVQTRLLPKYESSLDQCAMVVVDKSDREKTRLAVDTVTLPEIQAHTATTGLTYSDFDDRKFLAALMFTSGSTGQSRGVMVTHRNIIANTTSIVEYLRLTSNDRMMVVLPFYYCYGTSLLHTHLRVGGSVVIDTHFMFPDRVLKNVQQTRCTGFAGVPATFQLLLRQSSFKKLQFPTLRHVQQAGGSLPDVFINELRATLAGVRIFIMYGQTEATARLSYLPPEMLDTKPGSIGRGIPGVRLTVMSPNGSSAASGEIGEIVAEGDNIAAGYWNSEEETAAVFRDGKLYTGDLATVDDEGYMFIVGRAKDFIKPAGQRVSCQQIETTVLGFPGLVEAAVIGIPDDLQGEAIKLFVVHPQGDRISGALKDFCTEQLPIHQWPKEIIFRPTLPKNGSGKLDRLALKRA